MWSAFRLFILALIICKLGASPTTREDQEVPIVNTTSAKTDVEPTPAPMVEPEAKTSDVEPDTKTSDVPDSGSSLADSTAKSDTTDDESGASTANTATTVASDPAESESGDSGDDESEADESEAAESGADNSEADESEAAESGADNSEADESEAAESGADNSEADESDPQTIDPQKADPHTTDPLATTDNLPVPSASSTPPADVIPPDGDDAMSNSEPGTSNQAEPGNSITVNVYVDEKHDSFSFLRFFLISSFLFAVVYVAYFYRQRIRICLSRNKHEVYYQPLRVMQHNAVD